MACQCLTSQCRRPSWNHFAYERAGKALDAKRDISSQKKQSFAPNRFSGPRWYTFDRFGYIRKTNSLRFHRPYQRLCRSRWEWSDAAPPASSLSLGNFWGTYPEDVARSADAGTRSYTQSIFLQWCLLTANFHNNLASTKSTCHRSLQWLLQLPSKTWTPTKMVRSLERSRGHGSACTIM